LEIIASEHLTVLQWYQNGKTILRIIMNYRTFFLSVLLLGLHHNAAAEPLVIKNLLEQACSNYLKNSKRNPKGLITCLQYFQRDSIPSRNITLIAIINELYVADLVLLNTLSHIAQRTNTTKAHKTALFPRNLTAASRKLYHQAERLIMQMLKIT
jgi:hypothetical protein